MVTPHSLRGEGRASQPANQVFFWEKKCCSIKEEGFSTPGIKNRLVPISKHFPSAIKEWDNSVYAYNLKETILLPAIDKIVIRLVKSYFNAYFLSNRAKDSTPTPKLSVLNKTYVSKPEIKHTNSKVIVTIYKYSSSLKKKNKKFANDIIRMSNWQDRHMESKDKKYNDLLSKLISEFYNKKVSFRIIDLKYLHLNTSILVEYLANKLTNRKKVLRKYRFLLKKIKLPLYNKYTHSTVVDNSIFKALSLKNVDNITAKEVKTNLGASSKKELINKILTITKYKSLIGVRFEIGGRLTRRNVAAKSIFKVGQIGTLKNIDSSYKEFKVVALRGHVRPNMEYFNFSSSTRTGAFNVKGWTACH